tara:strand:+ start:2299 stop:3087 length:789 start_codon:yes stop_codon:yes gene_type:complete
MHRTGSTLLVELLNKYVPNGKIVGVHERPGQDIYKSNRFFLGSIRNPWEWYVSAWSFGCVKRGGLYKRLALKRIHFKNLGFKTKPLLAPYIFLQQFWRPLSLWRKLYNDPKSIKNFREWLKLLLGGTRIHDIGEGFDFSSINKFSGLMTYRYLVFYSSNIKSLYNNSLTSFEDLEEFDKKNNILNYTIRNESLEKNFFDVLLKLNIKISEKEKDNINNLKRGKWGVWRDKKLEDFYDDECLELIEQKEKLIINKYKYKKPHK